jgi:hypothetical protein
MDELLEGMDSRLGCLGAAWLAEISRFDHGWGKDFAAGIGGDADAIEQEVMRRVGSGIHPRLVKMAVADALDNRKPQW